MLNDTVKCMVCGVVKKDLRNHLKLHNITTDQYRLQYENAEIVSQNTREKMTKSLSAAGKRRGPPTPETRAKISEASKRYHEDAKNDPAYIERQTTLAKRARDAKGEGFRHSEATKQKMRGPRPNAVGLKKSPEHRLKLSKSRMGKTFSHTEETKEKLRAAWVTRRENKEAYREYVETRSKQRSEYLANNPTKYSNTSIEIKMKHFLEEHDLDFKHQYAKKYESNYFVYDFLIPSLNLLVEVDGEYWHNRPEMLSRDVLKEKAAASLGFRFVRISDMDWNPEVIFESDETIQHHNDEIRLRRKGSA